MRLSANIPLKSVRKETVKQIKTKNDYKSLSGLIRQNKKAKRKKFKNKWQHKKQNNKENKQSKLERAKVL